MQRASHPSKNMHFNSENKKIKNEFVKIILYLVAFNKKKNFYVHFVWISRNARKQDFHQNEMKRSSEKNYAEMEQTNLFLQKMNTLGKSAIHFYVLPDEAKTMFAMVTYLFPTSYVRNDLPNLCSSKRSYRNSHLLSA